MTATAPMEQMLREALERLERQERRTAALEAALVRPTRPAVETPPDIPWPARAPARLNPQPDRIAELEARLAEAEERLRAATRLETVGRLVAGVAHDFNNLLTVMTGNAEMIRGALPAGEKMRESAEQIIAAAHTAAGVTRQLLAVGRPAAPQPCPLDANAAVQALERVLGRLVGARADFSVALAATVPLIRVDPAQFDQVLLNLVANARDAVEDGGAVSVRTAAARGGGDRAGWPGDLPAGEFLALTVTDNGAGMTADVKARIFDPFFTTKGQRGTGLGLANVRDIVRAAGGHIEIESALGWGTSVRVWWPAIGAHDNIRKLGPRIYPAG